MTHERWGVWGGKDPGGWCEFGEHPTAREWGTRDEAEALKALFDKEAALASRRYDVVPFDDAREPDSVEDVPTAAQKSALQSCLRYGTFYQHTSRIRRSTIGVLRRNGWIMYRTSERVTRVTAAGHRALAR
jgi:hypothetical protein